ANYRRDAVDYLDFDYVHYDRFRRVAKHLAKLEKVSNPPPKRTWRWVSSFKPSPESLPRKNRSGTHAPGKCSGRRAKRDRRGGRRNSKLFTQRAAPRGSYAAPARIPGGLQVRRHLTARRAANVARRWPGPRRRRGPAGRGRRFRHEGRHRPSAFPRPVDRNTPSATR